ncbi:RNA12 protein-domain-containing protein [Crassisporium funariophilum]|nr:RNA12 protein-domain-containing protein [Crassisporium funariophilum]
MLRSTVCSTRRSFATQANSAEAWLYVDSVFPIQIASWDLRHYIGIFRQEHLLSSLQTRLEALSSVHNFHPIELQPQRKDGGVFVRFSYNTDPELVGDPDKQLSAIESALREENAKHGALPSWVGLGGGNIWLVKGSPWKEDMFRFASPILKVAFEGPDVQEQSLYELCRPFGRISDITQPTPVPAGTLRSSTVTFRHIPAATIARNVIHGLDFPSGTSSAPGKTRLRAAYQQPIQAHAIRDWMSSHPKIMLPLLVFLLGTLTYTIFDPIRALMVEGKMLEWFDYTKFKLYKWVRINAFDRLRSAHATTAPGEDVWKERKDAEAAITAYLSDMPTTIAFVHGPQGSGKTTMLETVIKQSGRNTLVIDCRVLHNTTSNSKLVAALAAQTGYWPVFTFLDSMNSLIDLASVGLIGSKTGLSSSLPDQLKQILGVTTSALKGVTSSHRNSIARQIRHAEQLEIQRIQSAHKRQSILQGTWHDGRLDCVAGTGVISELGVGDESFEDGSAIEAVPEEEAREMREEEERVTRRMKTKEDLDAIRSLPIVVVRNYAVNMGSASKEDVLEVLAQWAATLVENQIAHVIVLSDNRENAKRLAKALPSKPLNSIALSDADAASSLSFVKQKLHDAGIDIGITGQQTKYVERLGGRASDLESLIHKVRNGMSVEEAVEDIVSRGVAELRKNAFGEDMEDAKGLAWTREQAWKVLKMLSKKSEVAYYDVLVDFPFKGDESALRSMEHAELIAIGTKDGRPSAIRPGKPVFRWVFERLVNDRVFEATQELGYNEKQIAESEGKIKSYEQELALLVDTMQKEGRRWWQWGQSACVERARSVGDKMVKAQRKVDVLERKNVELKKVLGKDM